MVKAGKLKPTSHPIYSRVGTDPFLWNAEQISRNPQAFSFLMRESSEDHDGFPRMILNAWWYLMLMLLDEIVPF